MPLEVMTANPVYNESVDELSYGIMILSGGWPEPQCGPVCTEAGKLMPVSEAEQCNIFLYSIVGEEHPLMHMYLLTTFTYPY